MMDTCQSWPSFRIEKLTSHHSNPAAVHRPLAPTMGQAPCQIIFAPVLFDSYSPQECLSSDHCYTLIAQTRPGHIVGVVCMSVAQENELLGSFGILGRDRETTESSRLGKGGGGGREVLKEELQGCCSCPWVPLAGPSCVQILLFPLLLPKVESNLEPPRTEACPRAPRELKTRPRIFRVLPGLKKG